MGFGPLVALNMANEALTALATAGVEAAKFASLAVLGSLVAFSAATYGVKKILSLISGVSAPSIGSDAFINQQLARSRNDIDQDGNSWAPIVDPFGDHEFSDGEELEGERFRSGVSPFDDPNYYGGDDGFASTPYPGEDDFQDTVSLSHAMAAPIPEIDWEWSGDPSFAPNGSWNADGTYRG